MIVDGGDNCNYFGYEHLFYVLFDRPTYVHVTGNPIFSADDMVLVPVMFPGWTTLQSFYPSYWTSTDHTHTLSLSALKFVAVFMGPPMKISHN